MHCRKFISVDTETTGLYPEKGDRIIEIALVEILNDRTKLLFHSLLNSKKKISKDSFKVHKISKNDIKNKPTFKDVNLIIEKILENSIIISHNAKFDLSFIKKEFCRINKKKNFIAIDTLKIARKIFPGKKNNLSNLCKRLKIFNKKEHSAIHDAFAVAKIFIKLRNKKLIAKVS